MGTISSQILSDTLILTISGNFDRTIGSQFQQILERAKSARCRNVRFEFQHVTSIDSSGLGMVFLAAHYFRQKGGRRSILSPHPVIREVLERADMPSLVEIVNVSDQALPAA